MNRLSGQPRIGVLSLLNRPEGNVGVELGVAAAGFSRQLLDSGRFRLLPPSHHYSELRHKDARTPGSSSG